MVPARRVLPRRRPGGVDPRKGPLAPVRGARVRARRRRPGGHVACARGRAGRVDRAHGGRVRVRAPRRAALRPRPGLSGARCSATGGPRRAPPRRGGARDQARRIFSLATAAALLSDLNCVRRARAHSRGSAGVRHHRHARVRRDPVCDRVRRARRGFSCATAPGPPRSAGSPARPRACAPRRRAVSRVACDGRVRAGESDPHRDPGTAGAWRWRAHRERARCGIGWSALGGVPGARSCGGGAACASPPCSTCSRPRLAVGTPHVPAAGGGRAAAEARLPG